ncbi:DUF2254 domain-containing protein (plasmid) [Adhaeribacter swui]|uniref:DUF2254 domain-containing protein n=1 Tax=Adhaeribacter swui TaxID=2086471 RepID=A0A7G7G2D4_9BACT|nr:DUF2254 domain-containing protein [Adhaeribacter swui]QNF31318.1 DUF2254 domain-containing protein [Adhaeribacter swui]
MVPSIWLKEKLQRTITSIAFLPAIIALSFLVFSWITLELDFSELGKSIKAQWQWLRLKDASTARNIIATVASGIISLTVFSFSMVMIVLNQAASQLSNRVLDKLIGNRFQQVVLGFYIGTIVYALFLLSTIRDVDQGIQVPALSTYFLIFLTISDIFLFIYFLHYITQSVKYENIINQIHKQTKAALVKECINKTISVVTNPVTAGYKITAPKSGVYQGFEKRTLLEICDKENLVVAFVFSSGTYVLKGTPLLIISNSSSVISSEVEEKIIQTLIIQAGEVIPENSYYGFRQLMEVAIKALSPGINDPGTAILSLNALADLLAYRMENLPDSRIRNTTGLVRIYLKERTFEEIFFSCILPIWDYGKEDHSIQQSLYGILLQLQTESSSPILLELLEAVQAVRNSTRNSFKASNPVL